MRKIRNTAKVVTAGILILAMAAGMTACGKTDSKVSADNKTLNLRVYKSGYGDDYVRALAAAFETTYAEEGYKVNIVSSDSSIQGNVVTNEMLLGENNGIDLYITGNVEPTQLVNLSKENDVDMIAADLTDVYQAKPIRADKSEEDITILEKLKNGYADYKMYNGDMEEYKGKYYGFAFRSSPCGLIVNEELLTSYGLEIPRTTNELLTCFDVINEKKEETGVYPTAWAGYNAYTYWYMVEDVWAAQYDGVENYNKFLSMNYSDNPEEGWRVYESRGWKESLNVLGKVVNLDNAPEKTISMDHSTAQHRFLSGDAVFMVNGAWLQNEMSANYLDQVKGMRMIETPVVSALGEKIGLESDETLSSIVGLIDEGKSIEEIVTAVNGVTAEQVQAVCDARNIFYDWGCSDTIVVNACSSKLDLAKLFLRYMASDDGIKLVYDYSSSFTAFTPLTDIGMAGSDSTFMNSINAIASRPDARYIYRTESGWRSTLSFNWFNKYGEVEKQIASAKGTLTGDQIMEEELAYIKDAWAERMAEYNK